MKCFMPVYALALALAVTDKFEHVSGASCLEADVCPSGTTCTAVTDGAGTSATTVTKPSTLTCATGKFAYISSFKIVPDTTSGSAAATDLNLYTTKDGTTTATATTAMAAVKSSTGTPCDNTYLNVGADATGDVKAVVGCATSIANCKFKYLASWACQAPDSCALTAANCPSCTTATIPKASGTNTLVLAKPSTVTCPTGKFAYLKSLTVGADTTANAGNVAVTFTGATGLTGTKSTTTCDGKWANVGMSSTLTEDVKATVTCATGSSADCIVKYVGEWACQVDSCAVACTDAACTAASVPVATPLTLTRDASAAACPTGMFPYISSLDVGVTGTTTSDKVAVTFKNGATTALTGTSTVKSMTTCDGKWADVGKTEATAAIQATITCSDSAAACGVKYKAVWMCQTAAASPTPAPTNATNATVAPTATPTATPKASGVTMLTGANPVVVWGTTLVAAVAGANFAAAL